MPLRLRLAGLVALGTAAAVGIGSIVFVHLLAAGLRSSVDSGLRVRADVIAQTLDTNVPQGGPPATVTPLHGQSDGMAQVFGPSGRLVSASPDAGEIPLVTPSQLARARREVLSFSVVLGGGARQQGQQGGARQQGNDGADSPHGGEHTRIFAAPVARTRGAWVIVVGTPLDTSDAAIRRVNRAAAIGALPAVALAAAVAWLLASAALRPVERMRRQVADITAHDPHAGIEVPKTRDELAALATTMNDLLARLGDALDRERSFVADAGHELRTPLAILRTELELASRPGRTHAELAAAVAAAAEETDRLARLAEDLLLLARSDDADSLRREPTDLHRLLTEATDRAATLAQPRRVGLTVEAPPGLEAEVDPDRIRRAVDNLIDNALRHAPSGSTVRVRAAAYAPRPSGAAGVALEVSDEGPGFPPAFLSHAFERFRRADTARAPQDGGAGLGLAIVASIARAHGGRALATNRPEGGATVRIELPASPPPATPPPATPPPATPAQAPSPPATPS
ncbi:MAG: sensor histidine kinase [Acidimicrobiales bacterium]